MRELVEEVQFALKGVIIASVTLPQSMVKQIPFDGRWHVMSVIIEATWFADGEKDQEESGRCTFNYRVKRESDTSLAFTPAHIFYDDEQYFH